MALRLFEPERLIGHPPLHLFAAATIPTVALATANQQIGVRATDVVAMLLIDIAVALVAWIAAATLTRSPARRGVLALIGVAFCLWFGPFLQAAGSVAPALRENAGHGLVPAWVGLATLLVVALQRTSRELAGVGRYLTAFTGLFLAISLASLGLAEVRPRPLPEDLPLPADAPVGDAAFDPDVYVLILDKYSGPRSLERGYDYDLEPFLDELRSRGFFVPTRSRVNYAHTHLSLASMLNWTHLRRLAAEIGADSRDRSRTIALIESNRLVRYLKRRSYEFVFFPSAYAVTAENRLADRQLPRPYQASLNFLEAWFLQTPFPALYGWACTILSCTAGPENRFPFPPETAETMEWKFRRLAQLASEPGPKLVFAHLLIPHEPYIFRADCSHRPPLWPRRDTGAAEALVRDAYAAQIACLNRMLLELVDALLENPDRRPVIVLQSDHGHGRMTLDAVHNATVPLERLDPERIAERLEPFAAYRLPTGAHPAFYDSITPVNVFPIVLNSVFGERIPLVEDATYWSEPQRPYDFTRIR